MGFKFIIITSFQRVFERGKEIIELFYVVAFVFLFIMNGLVIFAWKKWKFHFIVSSLVLLFISPFVERLFYRVNLAITKDVTSVDLEAILFFFATLGNSYVLLAIGLGLLIKRVFIQVKNNEWTKKNNQLLVLGLGGLFLAPVVKMIYFKVVSRISIHHGATVDKRLAIMLIVIGMIFILIWLLTKRWIAKRIIHISIVGLLFIALFPIVKLLSNQYYLFFLPYQPYEARLYSYALVILFLVIGVLFLFIALIKAIKN